MISLLAMCLTIAGVGLLGIGSAWCVPAFIAAGFGWMWADKFSVDFEFLGGLLILVMGAGVTYAIVRSILGYFFGF